MKKTAIPEKWMTVKGMKIVGFEITKRNKQLENLIDLKWYYLQLECLCAYVNLCLCCTVAMGNNVLKMRMRMKTRKRCSTDKKKHTMNETKKKEASVKHIEIKMEWKSTRLLVHLNLPYRFDESHLYLIKHCSLAE